MSQFRTTIISKIEQANISFLSAILYIVKKLKIGELILELFRAIDERLKLVHSYLLKL